MKEGQGKPVTLEGWQLTIRKQSSGMRSMNEGAYEQNQPSNRVSRNLNFMNGSLKWTYLWGILLEEFLEVRSAFAAEKIRMTAMRTAE